MAIDIEPDLRRHGIENTPELLESALTSSSQWVTILIVAQPGRYRCHASKNDELRES
jgi:hypothetical protein